MIGHMIFWMLLEFMALVLMYKIQSNVCVSSYKRWEYDYLCKNSVWNAGGELKFR